MNEQSPSPIPFPRAAGIRENVGDLSIVIASEELDYVIVALLDASGVAREVGLRLFSDRLTGIL